MVNFRVKFMSLFDKLNIKKEKWMKLMKNFANKMNLLQNKMKIYAKWRKIFKKIKQILQIKKRLLIKLPKKIKFCKKNWKKS